jgi:hypothetical protein
LKQWTCHESWRHCVVLHGGIVRWAETKRQWKISPLRVGRRGSRVMKPPPQNIVGGQICHNTCFCSNFGSLLYESLPALSLEISEIKPWEQRPTLAGTTIFYWTATAFFVMRSEGMHDGKVAVSGEQSATRIRAEVWTDCCGVAYEPCHNTTQTAGLTFQSRRSLGR